MVTNATTDFVITSGASSGPSTQIFATEDGTIAGWNSTVDPNNAVIAVNNSAAALSTRAWQWLSTDRAHFSIATNFHAGTVDVFDSKFKPARIHGTFTDPQMPAGYAPFGIAAINSKLYVTFAQPDAAGKDDVKGAGHGFIDIFDTQGNFVQRFASQGQLNSPWGMAWAPFESFGDFNNALLVGNFGDGTINAFDFDQRRLSRQGQRRQRRARSKFLASGPYSSVLAWPRVRPALSILQPAGAMEDHGLFGTLAIDPASLPKPEDPAMTDPNLHVTTVVSGLDQPTSMVFLGPGDFLILEKATGKVQHVVNGAVAGTALDLPVNSSSERGLLGIALAPDFDQSHFVYLYWTQSTTGADSTNLAEVPLLGNRVDRYTWDPTAQKLTFNRNIITLHAFQADRGPADAGQSQRRKNPVWTGRQALPPDRRSGPARTVAEPRLRSDSRLTARRSVRWPGAR